MLRLATLSAVCLVAFVGAGALGAATGAPSALPNCLGKPVVRPSGVILACADAGLGVRSIRWLGWGAPVAAGVGVAYANDCTPTCAAGHFHSYQGVLLLSGAQRCDGEIVYARAAVAVVGTPPQAWSTVADATYPLRCAP